MRACTQRAHQTLHARHLCRLALCVALAAAMPARAAKDDLTRLDLGQLMELTVVGAAKYEQKQNEVAAAASIITRREIQAFGWRRLGQALASLPGVYTTNDRQYTYLGARGFGLAGDYNTRVLVTINGNRANDPLYDGATFGRDFPLDMDLVERIEFIPGPGSAVYGQNAMFGVVNVVTRAGRDLGGTELAAAYQGPQSLREGRASWGKALDNGVDLLVSVSAMRSGGTNNFYDFGAAGVSGVASGLDGERNRQFFARAARGPWSMEFTHGTRRKDDPTAAYFSDPLVPGQYQNDAYSLAQLHYQDKFVDDALQVSGRLFGGQQRYRSRFVYDGVRTPDRGASDWHGAELRLVSAALTDHKIMLGIEYQDNNRIDQSVADPADSSRKTTLSSPGYRAGLYVQDEWHFAEALTATVGLRADRNDVTGASLSPRAERLREQICRRRVAGRQSRAERRRNPDRGVRRGSPRESRSRGAGDGLPMDPEEADRARHRSGQRIDAISIGQPHRRSWPGAVCRSDVGERRTTARQRVDSARQGLARRRSAEFARSAGATQLLHPLAGRRASHGIRAALRLPS